MKLLEYSNAWYSGTYTSYNTAQFLFWMRKLALVSKTNTLVIRILKMRTHVKHDVAIDGYRKGLFYTCKCNTISNATSIWWLIFSENEVLNCDYSLILKHLTVQHPSSTIISVGLRNLLNLRVRKLISNCLNKFCRVWLYGAAEIRFQSTIINSHSDQWSLVFRN